MVVDPFAVIRMMLSFAGLILSALGIILLVLVTILRYSFIILMKILKLAGKGLAMIFMLPGTKYSGDCDKEIEHYKEMEHYEKIRICPSCGSLFVVKKGRYGPFWGCTDYPECDYTESIYEEDTDYY